MENQGFSNWMNPSRVLEQSVPLTDSCRRLAPSRRSAGPSCSSWSCWERWGASSSPASTTTAPSCRRATGATTWTWSRSCSTRPASCTLAISPRNVWCSSSKTWGRAPSSACPTRPSWPEPTERRSGRKRRSGFTAYRSRSWWTSCSTSGTTTNRSWTWAGWPTDPERVSPGRTPTAGRCTRTCRMLW